ncbi:uncharacterized protein BDZ99DRAFT_216371 [Mytilinidion resinicola]|uniref:Apple domain-containing protein n=1 Tax=Mytilinidion resinicola TaxID=574789 RepID=A0A6A6Y132_9PEZI|nr:uncharacterized protein BDZ99DRAFT_216371 [Mytilinidion resinicola]KAF2801724.1 hypothetical protein BDZ99DRAFT_216371 [Mytilinidion resinicola]
MCHEYSRFVCAKTRCRRAVDYLHGPWTSTKVSTTSIETSATSVAPSITSFAISTIARFPTAFNASHTSASFPIAPRPSDCPDRNGTTYYSYQTSFEVGCDITRAGDLLDTVWTETFEYCMDYCDISAACVDVSFYPFGASLRTYPTQYRCELKSTLGPSTNAPNVWAAQVIQVFSTSETPLPSSTGVSGFVSLDASSTALVIPEKSLTSSTQLPSSDTLVAVPTETLDIESALPSPSQLLSSEVSLTSFTELSAFETPLSSSISSSYSETTSALPVESPTSETSPSSSTFPSTTETSLASPIMHPTSALSLLSLIVSTSSTTPPTLPHFPLTIQTTPSPSPLCPSINGETYKPPDSPVSFYIHCNTTFHGRIAETYKTNTFHSCIDKSVDEAKEGSCVGVRYTAGLCELLSFEMESVEWTGEQLIAVVDWKEKLLHPTSSSSRPAFVLETAHAADVGGRVGERAGGDRNERAEGNIRRSHRG